MKTKIYLFSLFILSYANGYGACSVNVSGNVSICLGDTLKLTAFASGIPPFTYSWSSGQTTSSVTIPNPSATYTVNVADSTGCHATATVNIIIHPFPVVGINPDTLLCGEAPCVQLSASGGVSYSWSPSFGLVNPYSDTTTACPFFTTTYTVLVTDTNGCTNTAQTIVTLNPPPPPPICFLLPDNDSICIGQSYYMCPPDTCLYAPLFSFSWSPASSLSNPNSICTYATPTTTTTYTLVDTYLGCPYDIQYFTLKVIQQPCNIGINEITGNFKCAIYPNPSKNFFKVTIDRYIENGRITIFTILGEKIYSDKFNSNEVLINCKMNDGIYFMQVTDGNATWTDKILNE